MIRAILAFLVFLKLCDGAPQFLVQSSLAQPHPAVLENAAMEALLPEELKNKFYKDPRIVAALAEPSWFGYKEGQVTHRESDMIPREKVYHILHNAGLVRR